MSLRIAHVTPFGWDDEHEVNRHVRRAAEALAARGHRVLVAAPVADHERVREDRRSIGAGGDLLPEPGAAPRLLAVGEALEIGAAGRRRAALPIDVARTVQDLLEAAQLDVLHVHEPFAPSVASVALRHSAVLNAGTFHLPVERPAVGRKVVETVLGRLDARLASWATTADLVARTFPAGYRVVSPGGEAAGRPVRGEAVPLRIAFVEREGRPALRLLLRALRALGEDVPWEARVVTPRGPSSSTPLRATLRERIAFQDDGAAEALAWADVAVFASDGTRASPGTVLDARAAGAAVLAARLPVYEEAAAGGLFFEPGDEQVLAEQLARLAADPALRERLRGEPPRTWDDVAAEHEEVYAGLLAKRRGGAVDPAVRARLERRPLVDVDLHMHTDHSHDCATPVEVLLDAARRQGLGAIAVTDHNVIGGAFEAAEKAAAYGVQVIVGEEVKTAGQGEVIGLFLREHIPRGLTLAETVRRIKEQGGLVYVPHPFDRMHSVPDYEHLLDIVEDIDAIEIYNARVAIGSFNDEARRFAQKYNIPAGAGSDAHVAPGLGSVRIRMRAFDGPEEFLASLREAEIHTNPASLLYVQALKFLETRATPPAAREAVRRRRVARASRKG
jgi:glycosyltransferase involved in cell wall biosynthesis